MSRALAVSAAVGILVLIGALEARASALQLAELGARARISPEGAGASALGLVASAAVYLALGGWLRSDRDALRMGALTGGLAGLIGGGLRAWIIAGAVRDAVDRYAAMPEWFVPVALVVYVAFALIVGAVAGAALALVGARARAAWTRPPA